MELWSEESKKHVELVDQKCNAKIYRAFDRIEWMDMHYLVYKGFLINESEHYQDVYAGYFALYKTDELFGR